MNSGPQIPFSTSARYPDPRVEVLDERFLKLRVFSSSVEQLFSGMRWAEGPVWFGDGRYLLVSDIPGNRILRWDEASGQVSEFRTCACRIFTWLYPHRISLDGIC
jgi:gluconolactonase